MNRTEWIRTGLVLVIFAAVFEWLTISSYRHKSATWDEPAHLTAGYTELALNDYRLDPGHLPLLRKWAALPLGLQKGIHVDTTVGVWQTGNTYEFAHQFMFVQNDADRMLNPARFMIVILGLMLGVLVYCWARELFGFWPAVVVLALYCFEPNILAHSSVVTTDLGTTMLIFGALYFLWRVSRNASVGNLVGLTIFFSLALVSKFSAVMLWPIAVVALAVPVYSPAPWKWWLGSARSLEQRGRKAMVAVALLGWLAVCSVVVMWALYGFRYLPTPGGSDSVRFKTLPMMVEAAPTLAKLVNWVDDHHLLPNACSQGFLFLNAVTKQRSAFLAGEYSIEGWWYYFPVAFLIKTPIVVIALFGAALVLCARRWRTLAANELFILLPIVVFLGMAMNAKINIGLRHILPIYPFVILLCGGAVAALATQVRRGRELMLALPLLAAVECALVYPHWLTFFNGFVGGPRNGYKYLVDSNLDWGQDLKQLKEWMVRNKVGHINLSYFGFADPAYYGIRCTHMPGAPFYEQENIKPPKLPGYVAVSATNLQGVYLAPDGRNFYQPLLKQEPVAILGHTIYIWYVDKPWWK